MGLIGSKLLDFPPGRVENSLVKPCLGRSPVLNVLPVFVLFGGGSLSHIFNRQILKDKNLLIRINQLPASTM